jgi:hypothetical protein
MGKWCWKLAFVVEMGLASSNVKSWLGKDYRWDCIAVLEVAWYPILFLVSFFVGKGGIVFSLGLMEWSNTHADFHWSFLIF